jgi:purine nucleosidase
MDRPASCSGTFESLPENSISLIPLDATRYVPITTSFAERLRADQQTPEAQIVAAIANHPLVAVNVLLASVYWWDPLTAMAATTPGVVAYVDERIAVVQDGAPSGRTVPSATGRAMHVAVAADQAGFEQAFLDTLNGRSTGPAP